MAKYPLTWRNCLRDFEKALLADPRYSKRTVRYYTEQAGCAFNLLELRNPDVHPYSLSQKDVLWLIGYLQDNNYAIATRKNYIAGVRKFCGHFNNKAVAGMQVRWPQDMRPNVDWLSLDQAKKLLEVPKTANQELVIHLELCMGFRRCEVARMKPEHIHRDQRYIEVIGKGTMGGKLRSVPFHPHTESVLNRYDQYRSDIIGAAQASHRYKLEIPENYLLYYRAGHISSYSDKRLTGIDKQIKILSDELGFEFSNHTLRRTFGRTMYRSNVPIATISKLLGHESTETTLKYIGVDLDDMGAAMALYALQ